MYEFLTSWVSDHKITERWAKVLLGIVEIFSVPVESPSVGVIGQSCKYSYHNLTF